VTELEIVIWSPSRIQAAPSPATIRVWNGDHSRRSSRAGIVLRIVFEADSRALIGGENSAERAAGFHPERMKRRFR